MVNVVPFPAIVSHCALNTSSFKPGSHRQLDVSKILIELGISDICLGFLCVWWFDWILLVPPHPTVVLLCFSPNREKQQEGKKGCSPAAGSCITPVKQHGRCYPHRFAASGVSGRHREQPSEKVHKHKQLNIQIKSFSPSLLVSHLSIKSMAYIALEDG